MKIHVPYTRVGEATYLTLLKLDPSEVTFEPVGSGWEYNHYLQRVWEQGEQFINLEHDVVPWPGALEEIWECPQPWCFYGYQAGVDTVANSAAPFGCVKFGEPLIAAMPHVWDFMRVEKAELTKPWMHNDTYFFPEAVKKGFTAHQHWPAVLNAHAPNPNRVDMTHLLKCPDPINQKHMRFV